MTLNMKKLFLILVLCLCSLASWAQNNYDFSAVAPTGQTLYYEIHSEITHIVAVTHPNSDDTDPWNGYAQPTGSLTIPSSVSFGGTPYSVTNIRAYAFSGCSSLTSVTIPNSVTDIGDFAFDGCSGLTSVTIPNSVTDIGDYAFGGCTNISFLYVPNSVTSIGLSAFSGIDTVYYGGSAIDYGPGDGNWGAGVVITTGYTEEGDPLVYESPNKTMVVGCSDTVTSVTIPSSVTTIGDNVFYRCFILASVTIPNSVTTIGSNAFYSCISLTCITIPNSVTTIGSYAFSGCIHLASVTIPNSVTNIGNGAFRNCNSLASVTIPNLVTTIQSYTFQNCNSLASVTIPESVTSIGNSAFEGCTNVTTLNYNAKNLTTTSDWYNNSEDYNTYGFRPMQLQTLVIGDSVKTLPAGVFYGQSGLTSLTIPEAVTTIENQAFVGCTNVTTLNYNAKNLTTTSDWYNIYADYNTYGFRPMPLQTLVIGDSVETLPQGVFYKQASITSLTIPTTVTSIGEYAFNGCRGLTGSLILPESVTAIGNNAFEGCGGLTGSLTIPHSVTTIGDHTFAGCSGFTDVTIPNSVTTIENHAFVSCDFASVVIGSKVATIGQDAFGGCLNLKTVYNLSNLPITKGATDNGYVAWKALRVLSATNGGFTNHGAGENTLHQISTDYTVVDAEDDNATSIPRSTIPTNFIYYYNSNQKGWSWKANEIFLTDDTSRFVAPVEFTAAKATYSREFTNSNRSTLYLPFTAAVPEGFEVYDFAGFDGHTLTFSNHEGNIAAYTPYLVGYNLSKEVNTTQCTFTQENVAFPASSSAAPTPINGMTFQGTTVRTCMTDNNYGYRDGFFVQSANGSGHDAHAHVNPFRAYFTYSPSSDAPQILPPTLNVEVSYGDPVGIDAVEAPEQEYDGRYGNDVYDMLGRLVRKNADNLEGLPQGIYIWKGKKVVRGER